MNITNPRQRKPRIKSIIEALEEWLCERPNYLLVCAVFFTISTGAMLLAAPWIDANW